jgi:hypothetical protein
VTAEGPLCLAEEGAPSAARGEAQAASLGPISVGLVEACVAQQQRPKNNLELPRLAPSIGDKRWSSPDRVTEDQQHGLFSDSVLARSVMTALSVRHDYLGNIRLILSSSKEKIPAAMSRSRVEPHDG